MREIMKENLSLRIVLMLLVVTLISMFSVGTYLAFRPITIYKGYAIDLMPGQTFKIGQDIPYIASGNKLQDISGVVNRRLSCDPLNDNDTTRTVISIEQTPTNSVPGKYKLQNKIPTGSALSYSINLPASCYIFNQVSFKPNPLHAAVTYTAISMHDGKISTFTLTKQ